MDASKPEPARVRTTCPYCGVGCGVIATPRADGTLAVAGDPEHPANFGRLCSKGTALAETVSRDGRLLHPEVAGEPAGWDTALDLVARRFSDAIAEHGPESVAFYVSGQLLSEDYYVANKLMKGFIGSANIDTNSRLCMASSVAGHKRAFGTDTVPGCYEDLEEADLVVLVGSNLAWCHPVLFQRLSAARDTRGTKVVVIDPRRTATCAIADRHLAIAGGSDVALFNGLLAHLAASGAVDADFVARRTTGVRAALDVASALPLAEIARLTGLGVDAIAGFYDEFARTPRVVTVYSQGVNQSTAGTDKVNAIINCHLATGRIGKPGMGPFSVTGQPNAMGGREVGGLANMLAAHMEIGDSEHRRLVQAFWRSPRIADTPGLKAVDLFRAVGDGRIKALWIMGTNPAVSLPDVGAVRAALAACPFVVVSDVERHTDTTAYAHVLLPSASWGEKDGTVTNSERRISRQRAFLPPAGEARADWWQMAEVARRMGHAEAFAWTSSSQIFAEYAELTGLANGGARDLDLSALADMGTNAYQALAPVQWPVRAGATGPVKRFFADGRFYTPDGRARFVPTPYREPQTLAQPERGGEPGTLAQRTLVLNTGRIRDQWHTMTRTGRSARLASHLAEPFVEINAHDALVAGVAAADLVTLTGHAGRVVARAVVTDRVRRGSVFLPMHWSDRFASSALAGALLAGNVDAVSGQPELKHGAVRVERFAAGWYAFAAGYDKPAAPGTDYWAMACAERGWRMELASLASDDGHADVGPALVERLWPGTPEREVLSYIDRASGETRYAVFDGERLVALVFVGRSPVACDRAHVLNLLGQGFGCGPERLRVLAGRAGAGQLDAGPTVCACMGVGRNQILSAIAARRGHCTVDQVGAATGAGTNCGSCRPEIGAMIAAAACVEEVG